MKLKVALAFALLAGISPALALAKPQGPIVHQHGASIHDRSPHIHLHESQPHH